VLCIFGLSKLFKNATHFGKRMQKLGVFLDHSSNNMIYIVIINKVPAVQNIETLQCCNIDAQKTYKGTLYLTILET